MKNRLKFMLGLLLAAASISGCTPSEVASPKIRGRVIDKASSRPVAGALVFVNWTGESQPNSPLGYLIGSGHSSGSIICYHIETARTDDNGYFEMPAWRRKNEFNVKEQMHSFQIYRRDYRDVDHPERREGYQDLEVFEISRFSGSVEDRVRYLSDISPLCASNSDGNLTIVHETLLQEMTELTNGMDLEGQQRNKKYISSQKTYMEGIRNRPK